MAGTQAGVILRHVRGLTAGLANEASDRELLERYTAAGEEAAFAALVRRHGPLVLGVCRRILGNPHDAEDAFQAAFLTLAKKAGSIRKRESVGCWLYQVAYHTAVRARAQTAARKRVERKAGTGPQTDPLTELTGRELVAVLDAEVNALADRYRVPLVLCYFQGLTCDEAARRAGLPVRTLKRRLDQARERLRGRLTRRGLALPAVLSAAGLAQGVEAAVLASLAAATARAALRGANGGVTGSVMVNGAGALAGIRLKTVAAALLMGCLVTCGAVALAQQGAAPASAGAPVRVGKAPAQPQKKPGAPAAKRNGVRVAGRVVGADGKPLAGAEVALVGRWLPSAEHPNHDYKLLAHAKTDAEGRFRLARKDISPDAFYRVHALAGARGHGLGWRKLNRPDSEDLELRLEPERVVRGRLVDLQGLPAAGVKGRLAYVAWQQIRLAAGDPLQRQVQMQQMQADKQLMRARGRGVVPFRRFDGFEFDLPKAPEGFTFWPRIFTTDAQGRFEVRGLAAGQDAHLLIEDNRFALQELLVETGDKGPPAEARLSLAPVQRIEGRIVCADSGKPVAGAHVNVTAFRDFAGKDVAAARTDAEGRFSINPYPGTSYLIHAWAPAGAPYLSLARRIEWPRGSVRQTVDFALPRGVEVRGRVTETDSGKPLAQVRVVYRPRGDNETAQRAALLVGPNWPARTAADGSYRIVVPPGPGHLLVNADDSNLIRHGVTAEEIRGGKPGGRLEFHHLALALNPELKDGAKVQDIKLRRGVTVRATVLSTDGKPVRRGTVLCPGELAPADELGGIFFPAGTAAPKGLYFSDGSFELRGCDPARTYRVFVLDVVGGYVGDMPLEGPGRFRMRKQMAGTFLPTAAAVVEISPAKLQGGQLTVRLRQSGSARIKLRDADGKPGRVTPWLELQVTPDRGPVPGERAAVTPGGLTGGEKAFQPDAEGRVTIRGLIPGATYRLHAYDARGNQAVLVGGPFTVEAGKTRELPDAVAPRPRP